MTFKQWLTRVLVIMATLMALITYVNSVHEGWELGRIISTFALSFGFTYLVLK